MASLNVSLSSLKLFTEVIQIVIVLLVAYENKGPVRVYLFPSHKRKEAVFAITSESVPRKQDN